MDEWVGGGQTDGPIAFLCDLLLFGPASVLLATGGRRILGLLFFLFAAIFFFLWVLRSSFFSSRDSMKTGTGHGLTTSFWKMKVTGRMFASDTNRKSASSRCVSVLEVSINSSRCEQKGSDRRVVQAIHRRLQVGTSVKQARNFRCHKVERVGQIECSNHQTRRVGPPDDARTRTSSTGVVNARLAEANKAAAGV